MKQLFTVLTILIMFLFSSFQPKVQTDVQSKTELSQLTQFYFEKTTFYYGENSYDVTSRVPSINLIMSATPVGEKIVVECHVGPKNGVY